MAKASNSQKVLKGISSQTIVTLALGVVEVVSFSIMSRLLTKEDFGYYAAITAITTIFASFSETGIGSAIVQKKEVTKQYIDNAFTISLIFGTFISLLLFSLSGTLARSVADVSMKLPLMLMSVTLLLHCLTSVNRSLMHRRLEFFRMGAISLFSLIITTFVAVVLAYNGFGYYAIITKAVLQSVLNYLLTLYFCKTHFGLALDRKTFNSIFSFSGWLMASVLFRNLAHQIDKLLMPKLLSVSALGAYNRPKEFVEQISSRLNGIFDSALFPVLSNLQDDKNAVKSAFCRSMYLMNLFATVLTVVFFFNSNLIIRIFLGTEWLNLSNVMMITSLALLFNINGRLADCYLRSLAMTKQQFYFRIFETVVSFLCIIIGYRWGIIGVAFSFVVANTVTKLVKIFYIGNKVNITSLQCMRIMLSSWRFTLYVVPVCGMFLLVLPNNTIGNIVLFIVLLVLLGILFLINPNLVGSQYREYGYEKIMSYIQKKIRTKRNK